VVAGLPKRRVGRDLRPHPGVSLEHEIDRVRQATAERGIDYPVAVDNDYAIWTAVKPLLARAVPRRRRGIIRAWLSVAGVGGCPVGRARVPRSRVSS
jgi:hypothetical protein